MGNRKKRSTKGTLVYPKHVFLEPADLLHFVELKSFTSSWDDQFKNDANADDGLKALQVAIMCDPKGGSVIPGSEGLRKLRFAPPEGDTGKRGGIRVCYVYFERLFTVLLVVAYSKTDVDDIPKHLLKRINELIHDSEEELKRRHGIE